MTVTFGFYNSLNSDRLYNALQMSSLFDGIITDGVFASIGTSMIVTPDSGLSVLVGIGRAWFNHTWTDNDALYPLTLDEPHATLPRIDAIILEVDSSLEVRANSIKVKKGTAATVPAPPTMINDSTLHQHPIAYISIPVGLTTITSYNITNKVGTVDFPFITGPVASLSAADMIAQWEAEFNIWFDEMKDQLSEDAAGNLQNQIDDILAIEFRVAARQGHSSGSDWNVPGTTNYTDLGNVNVKVQLGNAYISSGYTLITYPLEFAASPIVFAQYDNGVYRMTAEPIDVSATGFYVLLTKHLTAAPYHEQATATSTVSWIAIGPMA